MLSLFPTLFAFEPLGPFFLRVTLGTVLIFWATTRIKSKMNSKTTALGVGEGLVGVFLVIGLLTQLAALFSAIVLFIRLIRKSREKALFTDGVNYYFILLIIAVSLLFIGPGAFAFDYPL